MITSINNHYYSGSLVGLVFVCDLDNSQHQEQLLLPLNSWQGSKVKKEKVHEKRHTQAPPPPFFSLHAQHLVAHLVVLNLFPLGDY